MEQRVILDEKCFLEVSGLGWCPAWISQAGTPTGTHSSIEYCWWCHYFELHKQIKIQKPATTHGQG